MPIKFCRASAPIFLRVSQFSSKRGSLDFDCIDCVLDFDSLEMFRLKSLISIKLIEGSLTLEQRLFKDEIVLVLPTLP